MRIKSNFGKRLVESESREIKRKIFFIFEGEKTEYDYFAGINQYKKELGIDEKLELHPIVNSTDEKGWSNPKKILDRFLKLANEEKIKTYETIKQLIVDFFAEKKLISRTLINRSIIEKSIDNKFVGIEKDEEFDLKINRKKIEEALGCICDLDNIIDSIIEFINESQIVYDANIDKVCLIVDRDRKSFVCSEKKDQFEFVKSKCEANKIDFFISNPCFEFWLILHFSDAKSLDYQKMLDNEKNKITKDTYATEQLKVLLPTYKKNRLLFTDFKDKINTAIENEKNFSESIEKLKTCVGSNLGILFKQILN